MSAIRVSKELAKAAKAEAAAMSRSAAAQLEHWANVGRAVEGCMSPIEVKALMARSAHQRAAQSMSPGERHGAPHRLDGRDLYEARIREEDPMPRLIARAAGARVIEVGQEELREAKLARQFVDYSVQRERIVPWKALSRFAGAEIKARFREVPLGD